MATDIRLKEFTEKDLKQFREELFNPKPVESWGLPTPLLNNGGISSDEFFKNYKPE